MTDAQIYVALVDKSIAYNKENDLSIDTSENPYDLAARQIMLAAIDSGTLSALFEEADALREVEKN